MNALWWAAIIVTILGAMRLGWAAASHSLDCTDLRGDDA